MTQLTDEQICKILYGPNTRGSLNRIRAIIAADRALREQPQPERKPMSVDEAWDLTAGCNGIGDVAGFELIRAVEAFHNIKDKP